MNIIERIHESCVRSRRVDRLSSLLTEMLPEKATCLDVGCGKGEISREIMDGRPDVMIDGIDILVPDNVCIPVQAFDGKKIPFPDDSRDATLLVDVLHHTDNPRLLLEEACRVSRRYIILKDHLLEGLLAGPTLKFMDDIGNRRFNVRLPHNYLTMEAWRTLWTDLCLTKDVWKDNLGLYPWPLGLLFDRSLHFIVRLEKRRDDESI